MSLKRTRPPPPLPPQARARASASRSLPATFPVRPSALCQRLRESRVTIVSKAREVATYSITEGERASPGHLREYVKPLLPCDLEKGFDTKVEKVRDVSLSPVFDTLTQHHVPLRQVQFLSYRHNISKLLTTPFNSSRSTAGPTWTIEVYRRGNLIVLDVPDEKEEPPTSYIHLHSMYWGYKFEQYCTRERHEQVEGRRVNPNNAFCSIVNVLVGSHRMLMAAEMDCYQTNPKDSHRNASSSSSSSSSSFTSSPPAPSARTYVELKTYKNIEDERVHDTFKRFKLLSFWSQCVICAVPKVVVGFRDNQGIVSEIREIQTAAMPRMAKGFWSASDCLNFLEYILSALKAQTVSGHRYSLTYQSATKEVCLSDEGVANDYLPSEFQTYLDSELSENKQTPSSSHTPPPPPPRKFGSGSGPPPPKRRRV